MSAPAFALAYTADIAPSSVISGGEGAVNITISGSASSSDYQYMTFFDNSGNYINPPGREAVAGGDGIYNWVGDYGFPTGNATGTYTVVNFDSPDGSDPCSETTYSDCITGLDGASFLYQTSTFDIGAGSATATPTAISGQTIFGNPNQDFSDTVVVSGITGSTSIAIFYNGQMDSATTMSSEQANAPYSGACILGTAASSTDSCAITNPYFTLPEIANDGSGFNPANPTVIDVAYFNDTGSTPTCWGEPPRPGNSADFGVCQSDPDFLGYTEIDYTPGSLIRPTGTSPMDDTSSTKSVSGNIFDEVVNLPVFLLQNYASPLAGMAVLLILISAIFGILKYFNLL